MKRSIGFAFSALVAAGCLAACNGGNGLFGPTQPTPAPNCNGPGKDMEVLYPKPNARHIPPGISEVFVATNAPLPSGNQFDLAALLSTTQLPQYTVNHAGQPITGAGSGFFTISPSSIPNPHATPSYPNATYYGTLFQYGSIGPLVTATLYWNDAGTGCNPNVILSTFTTGS